MPDGVEQAKWVKAMRARAHPKRAVSPRLATPTPYDKLFRRNGFGISIMIGYAVAVV